MSVHMLIVRRTQAVELGLPEEEMLARFLEFTQSLRATGALRAVERLKPSVQGTTVRRQDGLTTLVEGPYDGSEAMVGFYLIEAVDQETAQGMAKECPILLVGGSVEIRETEVLPQ